MADYEREDFTGPEGSYITITWDPAAETWRYRPVIGGPLLNDASLVALGLVAPVTPEPPATREPIPYSQRDPRWSGLPLGTSRYTVGSAGCAVLSVAVLATLVDPGITPAELVNYLNTHNGFTPREAGKHNSGGLLRWEVAAQAVEGLGVIHYHLWRDGPADVSIIKDRLSKGPQVVQVDFYPGQALDTHFVYAHSMTDDGKDINIIDPWTGEWDTVLGAYSAQGWDLARAVYAMAEFRLV